MIMMAVREIAIIHDDDVDTAMFSAQQVIEGARDAGSALTEQRTIIEKRQTKVRAAGDNAKMDQLRKRLKREQALGA